MASCCDVVLTATDIEITLHGRPAFFALRRRLRIPYAAVRSARAGELPLRPMMVRLGGTAIGRLRYGRFRRRGSWMFLAFRHPDHVLVLELDRAAGAPFDVVAVEVDGAEDLARRISDAAGATAAGTG